MKNYMAVKVTCSTYDGGGNVQIDFHDTLEEAQKDAQNHITNLIKEYAEDQNTLSTNETKINETNSNGVIGYNNLWLETQHACYDYSEVHDLTTNNAITILNI